MWIKGRRQKRIILLQQFPAFTSQQIEEVAKRLRKQRSSQVQKCRRLCFSRACPCLQLLVLEQCHVLDIRCSSSEELSVRIAHSLANPKYEEVLHVYVWHSTWAMMKLCENSDALAHVVEPLESLPLAIQHVKQVFTMCTIIIQPVCISVLCVYMYIYISLSLRYAYI